MFASEGIDSGRCFFAFVGFVGPMEMFGQNARLRSRRCGALARKVRIDFANRACASIFDGPLVFRGVGRAMGDGRWACAMTDESAVYSVYAKGIFHI